MTTKTNGHYYPRAEQGLADPGDPGDLVREPRPCCMRVSGGGWCTLPDGHPATQEHSGIPTSRYDHPQPPIDHRVMAKQREESQAPAPSHDVAWPAPGDRYRDGEGRILTITAVDPKSPIDRHIVGVIAGMPYSCDRKVFDAIWSDKV